MASAFIAPVMRCASLPARSRTIVGMLRMPKRAATSGSASVSTFATTTRPERSRAMASSSGATARHGPHQAAQKSTRTGTGAGGELVELLGAPHRDGRRQRKERRFACAHLATSRRRTAGTRLRREQDWQSTIMLQQCARRFRTQEDRATMRRGRAARAFADRQADRRERLRRAGAAHRGARPPRRRPHRAAHRRHAPAAAARGALRARRRGRRTTPPLYRYGAVAGLDGAREAFAARLARARLRARRRSSPRRDVLVGVRRHARALLRARARSSIRATRCSSRRRTGRSRSASLRAAGARARRGPADDAPLRRSRRRRGGPARRGDHAAHARDLPHHAEQPGRQGPLARAARRHRASSRVARGLWVLADEVYADYVYEGAHASIARLDGMAERTISVYSLSKSHALAGVRVGFAVGPSRVIAVARRISTHTIFNVPVAAQRLALAALREPRDVARRGARATIARRGT